MEIINQTPFLFAPYAGRIGYPGHSLTIIIKGTFDLVHGGTAVFAADPFFPTGDELYPDDAEGAGSLRYASDFACYKPRADLLLTGKCHAPAGRQVQGMQCGFGVGKQTKTLAVFGNRYWNLRTRTISDPEPFAEMALRYENSFGGEGFGRNPAGKGYAKLKSAGGKTIWPLPNLENPENLIDSPGKQPDPAGFGPLGMMWDQRYVKIGTYAGNWFKDRWPWFPADFDWGYFNAAPQDLQAEGFLIGDEPLFFRKLHPVHPYYESRLPGLKPRFFCHMADDRAKGEKTIFKEVPLNLDTLWVDMEAQKLVLVWRGVAAVLSEDYEEIEHGFIVSEKLDEAPYPVEHYHHLFLRQITEPLGPDTDAGEAEEAAADEPADLEAEIQKAEKEIRDALFAAGIDPDAPLPEPSPEDRAEEARIIRELGLAEEAQAPLTREGVVEKVSQKASLAGMDLRGIDLSGLDLRGADFSDAILSGVNLKGADLSGAGLSGAEMSGADLTSALLAGAVLSDADLTEAHLYSANLADALLKDAVFDRTDLGRAVLDGCTANGASFCEADLSFASCRKGAFRAADFAGCRLSGADFEGAGLAEAGVEDAAGVSINFNGADLSGLRASGRTDFSQGTFRQVFAPYSIWENAVLKGADFSFSQMEGANFASADLTSARFPGADLRYARLSKALLTGADFRGANLFEANLEKADLVRADFSIASMYGAEFLDARVGGTKFEGTNLKMTKLAR